MPVFNSKNEFCYFIIFCFVVFCLNVFVKYYSYIDFMDNGQQNLNVNVLKSYIKKSTKNTEYRVLQLQAKDFKFYTTTYKNNNIKVYDNLIIEVSNLDVSFLDYLKANFYMSSKVIKKLKKSKISIKEEISSRLDSIHKNSNISQFYQALYLANPISKELRDNINLWGISHLVAISGYHLGLIIGIIFFVCKPIFSFVYQRFFPYRNYLKDIYIFSFLVLFVYFNIIGVVPSFLRALLMSFIGFYFLCRNLSILNFGNLFIVFCLCICFFPEFIFSIGFYFSCAGVFYVLVYLFYLKDSFGFIAHSFFLSFYIFCSMQVLVLYFFPIVSIQQIFHFAINYIFLLFYPSSLFLHFIGFGGLYDGFLNWFLNFKMQYVQAQIPSYLFYLYNILTLLSTKSRVIFYLLPLTGITCFVYAIYIN